MLKTQWDQSPVVNELCPYDAYDYFHFNWGWGGAYDGYFSIDAAPPPGELLDKVIDPDPFTEM